MLLCSGARIVARSGEPCSTKKNRPEVRPVFVRSCAQRVIEPLELPLEEPLWPEPADGEALGPLEFVTELEELRSVPEFVLDVLRSVVVVELGVSALELLDDEGRSVLEPADELPGVTVVVEDDELDRSAGGVTVVEDDEEAPGRALEPVVLFLLSPQALSAAATAVTRASFAKVRKVLSIYTLLLWIEQTAATRERSRMPWTAGLTQLLESNRRAEHARRETQRESRSSR
jgi:hypothetical protein